MARHERKMKILVTKKNRPAAKLEARIFSIAFSAHFMNTFSLKKNTME